MKTLEQWAGSRGLNHEILERLGVSLVNETVIAPFIKNGVTINNKYRGVVDKSFRQDKSSEKIFYNQDVLFDESLDHVPLIITEGEVDCWTFISQGHPKCISVPDGAPNSETTNDNSAKYSYLTKEVLTRLKQQPKIILAVDNDINGQNLLQDLGKRIGRGKCSYVKYPKGCKDINDALMKYGPASIPAVLNTAKPLSQDGVYTLYNLPPIGDSTVYSSGLPGIDDHFKFRLGDFSITTGIPSMGKTTMFNHIVSATILKNNINVCFASLEQNPSLDHVRSLRAWYKGMRPCSDHHEATAWINKYFSFIYPSDEQQMNDELDLDWFLKQAEYAVHRMDAKIVILDPWNELEHVPYSDQSLTEYVGYAIRKLKRFAKVNNVHVAVIAHPTKQAKDKQGNFQIPTLYDVSDSAHWYNKADLGAIVHRDHEDGHTIFKVAKSRYHDIIGKPGQVKLKFDMDTKIFSEVL